MKTLHVIAAPLHIDGGIVTDLAQANPIAAVMLATIICAAFAAYAMRRI